MRKYEVLQGHMFNGGIWKDKGDSIELEEAMATVLKSHKVVGDIVESPEGKEPLETADKSLPVESTALDKTGKPPVEKKREIKKEKPPVKKKTAKKSKKK